MLSSVIGIQCSKRCELLLALAYLSDPERVVSVAHCIANDSARSAIRIAKALLALPVEQGARLARETLAREKIYYHGKGQGKSVVEESGD